MQPSDDALVLRVPASLEPQPEPVSVLVEIARSFSFKLNVGNYESRDFFCSQKAECRIEDSERVSTALHDFCKAQVLKAVREYKEGAANPAPSVHPVAQANAREFEKRQDDYNSLKRVIR